MYVKIDGELKSIKRIELKSDSTTILIHTITEEGLEEEYKCYSDSPNYYHLRCLLSADIYIISDTPLIFQEPPMRRCRRTSFEN